MNIASPVPKASPAKDARLNQFDSVRLLEDLPASMVMFLDDEITAPVVAAGATGAIVDVYSEDPGVYEVELTDPIPALATLREDQIERR